MQQIFLNCKKTFVKEKSKKWTKKLKAINYDFDEIKECI